MEQWRPTNVKALISKQSENSAIEGLRDVGALSTRVSDHSISDICRPGVLLCEGTDMVQNTSDGCHAKYANPLDRKQLRNRD
jgi:hypothetical protein